MTFHDQVNTIANLVRVYDLFVDKPRRSGRHRYQDIRGLIENRNIYIAINYTSKSIYWRDVSSGENKLFDFLFLN